MTSPRNPNSNLRWSNALDLVRPTFVLLLLALLPVAVLTGNGEERGRGEAGASELHHEDDRADSTRNPTHQA